MLAQQTPPITQVGAIKWVRDNLFPTALNAILTLASVYVIYYVISHVAPWMLGGIWDANSLSECREIRDATVGPDASVACWAVLGDRWHQLLFGFYPGNLYWRPIVALLLFLGGLSPILFPNISRKMLWLTAGAPFICFWLLWGGSIWLTISIALGFAAAYFSFIAVSKVSALAGIVAAVVVPVLYWIVLAGPVASTMTSILPIGIESVESRAFGGFMLSIVIGLSAIVLSLPLGILLALARQSDLFIIKTSAVVFIEVIRGVPLIVWLFTAQLLLNYFLPPGTNFDLTLRVIIMVTLFASAYIAEVVRGGLAALPTGQYEGANSLGLNYWQSMQLIVLPQALKISIPGIVNTFIGLFKDTTLVVFIGLFDPLGMASAIRASTDWNGIYWELFIFIGVMFFIFCFSMGRYSLYLEKKLQREHR
tara:strand:- start:13458 stop:14726 length:1269 start_codon:yes stop_codon:yes gene_type:complete